MNSIVRSILVLFMILCYTEQVKAKITDLHSVRASFYADRFEGRLMANGHRFHQRVLSAASLHFPLGSKVRVTNTKTGATVVLRITDRGPSGKRFGIDLSTSAFKTIGFSTKQGWGWVNVERVNKCHSIRKQRRHFRKTHVRTAVQYARLDSMSPRTGGSFWRLPAKTRNVGSITAFVLEDH